MADKQDIFKGVRRGAILLAALLIGVATYRILHAASTSDEASPPVSGPVEGPPPALTLGPPMVPPPPPLPAARIVRKRRVPNIGRASVRTVEPVPKVDHEIILPVENPEDDPDLAAMPLDEAPSAFLEREDEEPTLAQADVFPRRTSAHRLRWLVAVGKFLHIVRRNDVQSQALTPP